MMALTPDPEPTAPTLPAADDFYAEFKVGNRGTIGVQVTAAVQKETDLAVLTALCQQAAGACVPYLATWELHEAWTATLRFGDRQEGQALNQQFRHKEYVPNVLSFTEEAAIEGEAEYYVGDVFMTLPVVREEAAAQGKSFEDHLTHLVVHGLLHVKGFDHETAEDAAVMEDYERKILAGIGIADPYGDEA